MQHSRLWSTRYVHLLAIEAVVQFSTYMLNPVISSYAVLLGASVTAAGFVAGLVAVSALVMRPFTGVIADKVRKTTLLVLSVALFAVAAFGCAIADSVVLVGAFRVVQGVAFALRSAVVISLVSMVVAKDHLGRAVGWVGVATTVSCAVAPSAASLLGAVVGYKACFLIAAGGYVAGLVLAALFKMPGNARGDLRVLHARKRCASARCAEDREADAGALDERKTAGGVGKLTARLRDVVYAPAILYSAMAALSGMPHGINVSLLLMVGDARSISGVSVYFAFYALAALAARPFSGRMSDTKGFHAVIAPVLAVELAGVAVLMFMNSPALAALAGLLVGVGQGSAYSTLQAESVRFARKEELGRAANTYYIGPDVNMGLSPIVGGFVMQTQGVLAMYAMCFVAVFACLALALALRRRACLSLRGTGERD